MPRAEATSGGVQESFEGWILGSMTSGIIGIDTAGVVVSLNEGARRILACPRGALADAVGRPCRDVLAGQPAVARLLIETLERESPLSRAELELEGVSDSLRHTIGFSLTPVHDPAGQVRGAAIIFRDLTSLERSDEQDRLRERLAALGQMAAGLAHEIRNPLAGMEVLVGLLKRRLSGRVEEQGLLSELAGELRAVAETVSASLEFVRPAAPAPTSVNVEKVLEDALVLSRARVPFEGRIERDYAPDLPRVLADEDQLRTVLTNLLVNALEAMAEGSGRLELGLSVREFEAPEASLRLAADGSAQLESGNVAVSSTEVQLTVTDSGPGVPVELREKIFYPFFTTKPSGSGVGLAIAQKLVASHGGSLELDGRFQQGSRFRLRLPAEDRSS